jgi:nucleoside-diphosphate-sugar epimerase
VAEPGAVAITGASGYVGGLVGRRFTDAGWDVVTLRRTPSTELALGRPTAVERPFTLGEPLDPASLRDVQVVVHCAYDLGLTDPREIERVNVFGTLRLLDAAAAAGVKRVVLVSSMSAYEGTEQVYGRAKLACEQAVLDAGGVAVRLGLVYGEGWGGMAGSLRKLISLPVVPLMAGRSHQFTVHEDDAATGLVAVAQADGTPPGAVGLAHPQAVRFRHLLDGFARQAGVRPRFVPVPWRPVHALMRACERVGVTLPLRSDSLLGLVRPAPYVPGFDEWARLGVELRRFEL